MSGPAREPRLRTVTHWDDVSLGEPVTIRIKTEHVCYDARGIYQGLRRNEALGETAVCLTRAVIGLDHMGRSEFLRRCVVLIRVHE